MALGGSIYIDMVSDDPHKWEKQCDDLFKSVMRIVHPHDNTHNPHKSLASASASASGPDNSRGVKLTAVPSTLDVMEGTVKLAGLTSAQVSLLLEHLNMPRFIEAFRARRVDGETLAHVESAEEFAGMGVDIQAKARVLFHKVTQFKAHGVPEEMLVPMTRSASTSIMAPLMGVGGVNHIHNTHTQMSPPPQVSHKPPSHPRVWPSPLPRKQHPQPLHPQPHPVPVHLI
jgi:hypothetical protein